MFEVVEKNLDYEKKIKKVTKNTPEYDELLSTKIKCLKKQMRMRRQLKIESNQLQSQGKYTKVFDYYPGDSFGDDSLLNDDCR